MTSLTQIVQERFSISKILEGKEKLKTVIRMSVPQNSSIFTIRMPMVLPFTYAIEATLFLKMHLRDLRVTLKTYAQVNGRRTGRDLLCSHEIGCKTTGRSLPSVKV